MAPETEHPPEPRRITDLDALKVFTHPLRIELYRALFTGGAATASHLSDRVDEAVSLVSYHLRKMAAHGFIVEAPEMSSDGRERWWRVERGFTFRNSDFGDAPESVAVVGQVTRQLLRARQERYDTYLDHSASWGKEWVDAAFNWEYMPRLTVTEFQQLSEEIRELIIAYRERGRAAEAAGDTEGREQVSVQMFGFPFRP
ncbi:transcriptional regulator [Streptomyces spiroverticillatus]|uniref:Transcriptional regulator n=1 Tax=Streptomyces finlayi TaxID=67296 RepID=A0A918WXI4_9ACTN|nr:helix-turn-helix domain-containing protein [Streptomyces finlayi]GGZ92918.1 transcriptional regulator [Streptomyces spiroverticillatus]GHC92704.1 transcriptional regulator [Streptomyces finlayi]